MSLGNVLGGTRVVTLAVNVPGPVAASRLRGMGAEVVKVEPPEGDPLQAAAPDWYGELAAGQSVVPLDLKREEERERLETLLEDADLLLTSSRPAALERLGLGWEKLHARHPRPVHVAIEGYPPPREDRPGHDLTYQAELGLLSPPRMPRTLLADLAGAERAVGAALALLLDRERGGEVDRARVSLSEAAAGFAGPLSAGLTAPGGPLGGGDPAYGLYEARDGWISVAALEPRFRERLSEELGSDREGLAEAFARREAGEWEEWAAERDLPISAVREGAAQPRGDG